MSAGYGTPVISVLEGGVGGSEQDTWEREKMEENLGKEGKGRNENNEKIYRNGGGGVVCDMKRK